EPARGEYIVALMEVSDRAVDASRPSKQPEPRLLRASEVSHFCTAALLALENHLCVFVADLKLAQLVAAVVEVAHDCGRTILTAAGARATFLVTTKQQFNFCDAFHAGTFHEPLTFFLSRSQPFESFRWKGRKEAQ